MSVVFRQQRARWTAKMARVRLSSRAPWEQERRIVGMVASPVENLSIVLLKLDRPVQLSDFVRSVCVLGGQLGELADLSLLTALGANVVCCDRPTCVMQTSARQIDFFLASKCLRTSAAELLEQYWLTRF